MITHRHATAVAVWIAVLAACAITALAWRSREDALRSQPATIFDRTAGCTLVLPANPLPQERAAAELLRHTFSVASGLDPSAFPIAIGHASGRALIIGSPEFRKAGSAEGQKSGYLELRNSGVPASFRSGVSLTVAAGRAYLWSERREAIVAAAAWFLERHVGAHWFMPGPLGEEIPRRASLVLSAGDESAEPGFVSRDLGQSPGTEGAEWYARNKLEARLEHGHALIGIFSRRDLEQHPEMAPVVEGKKYLPRNSGDYNWQPDMTSPAAIRHAEAFVRDAFAANRQRVSVSISQNDAIRFDESPATRAVVEPLRYFRRRPDYSDLVFDFSNRVADAVRPSFPDKYLGAYAYYWSENTPRFNIAPNLVPWLTADRSQWFEPSFASEDRALIERWCHSGARIVGLYDYLEGEPYLIPRPVLYNVTQAIPFAYEAGARAYYGEGGPNWALDGPKLWLAAQLLWSPTSDPQALLETYYHEFWREAAVPMRSFYERCDRVWREQPRPGYWLKYYGDEQQTYLFPPAVRAELKTRLAEAQAATKTGKIRDRVNFVRAGFDVTDRFCAMVEQRDRVWRMARQKDQETKRPKDQETGDPRPEPKFSRSENSSAALVTTRSTFPGLPPSDLQLSAFELFQSWQSMLRARSDFVLTYLRVRAETPLAIGTSAIADYLYTDPSAAVVERLAGSEAGRSLLQQADTAVELTTGYSPTAVRPSLTPVNRLRDPGWSQTSIADVWHNIQFRWTSADSPWRGSGEPWETRRISSTSAADGSRVLRFEGCQLESIGQWVAGQGGSTFIGRVHFRGRVSPGNEAWLVVSMANSKNQYVGTARRDRVPPGDWSKGVDLIVSVRTPPDALWVGYSLRVGHQVNDDFAEFSGASLEAIPGGQAAH